MFWDNLIFAGGVEAGCWDEGCGDEVCEGVEGVRVCSDELSGDEVCPAGEDKDEPEGV